MRLSGNADAIIAHLPYLRGAINIIGEPLDLLAMVPPIGQGAENGV